MDIFTIIFSIKILPLTSASFFYSNLFYFLFLVQIQLLVHEFKLGRALQMHYCAHYLLYLISVIEK